MFGYVKTDTPNMYVKDTVLYKAMYCGLCKGIGCSCGVKGRFALNYDLTFLSLLLHNLMDIDVEVKSERCIVHWIRKRDVASVDELTKQIGALNVILAYHKLNDDVIDSGKGKIKRSFFNKPYKRAKKAQPKLDLIVKNRYKDLLDYEKTNGDSIDLSADPFGNMLVDIVEEIVGERCDQALKDLAYHLGKWIYLIDALDDFDKDLVKNNYNVFVNTYKQHRSKCELLTNEREDIEFVFGSILNRIKELVKQLNYKFNHDLIDNVLINGLKIQSKMIMENIKCKNSTKS